MLTVEQSLGVVVLTIVMTHVDDGVVRILCETVTCPQSGVVRCDQLSGGDVMIAKSPPLTLT